jgi:hypothetical protein
MEISMSNVIINPHDGSEMVVFTYRFFSRTHRCAISRHFVFHYIKDDNEVYINPVSVNKNIREILNTACPAYIVCSDATIFDVIVSIEWEHELVSTGAQRKFPRFGEPSDTILFKRDPAEILPFRVIQPNDGGATIINNAIKMKKNIEWPTTSTISTVEFSTLSAQSINEQGWDILFVYSDYGLLFDSKTGGYKSLSYDEMVFEIGK